METSGLNAVIRHVRRVVLVSSSDEELLCALACRRDEDAFEVLLRRHGPMVWAVCRRVLRHTQDAEDAFQAAFLVLIRKAATIRKRESIASWLYGVAYRTARKAQAMNARRRYYESQAAHRPQPDRTRECPELDQELNALPEKYRLPVVLCELQGRTRKEVAQMLAIPEGTLSSRLATARKTLAKRLGQPGSLFVVQAAARSSLPVPLIVSTVKVASLAMAGGEAIGVVSTNAIVLSHGVLHAMLMMKLKSLAVAVVVMGSLGVGVGSYTHHAMAGGSGTGDDEPQGQVGKPDKGRNVLEEAEAGVKRADEAVKQAESNLATARAYFKRMRRDYEEVVKRSPQQVRGQSNPQKTNGPEDRWSRDVASRFKYRIPVELGKTQSNEGCSIEIKEIWGTRPKIEVGGQYMVHGKCTMPSRKRGKLYFFVTSTGAWGQSGEATFDLQSTTIEKDNGEFTLIHGMGGPGDFHLILYSADDGKEVWLANQYFK